MACPPAARGRRYGRAPTIEELANATELKPHHVEEALDAVEASVSLNQTIGDGDGELGDLFADRTVEDPIEQAETSLEQAAGSRRARRRCPSASGRVLELRFGFARARSPSSLEQIGKELGVTRQRIRQLETTRSPASRSASGRSRSRHARGSPGPPSNAAQLGGPFGPS